MAKRKKTRFDASQECLLSIGEHGPTPERARHAGDPLVRHRASGEMRRTPNGQMDRLDSGGIRVASDTLELLRARRRLCPADPDMNGAMFAAGRRLEGLIQRGGMTGAIASANLMGAGPKAPSSPPYVGSVSILDARNEISDIRTGMVVRDWQALEWIVLTGLTVEQGGHIVGSGKPGEAILMDRVRGGLEWLVGHWGMMRRRAGAIRAERAA